MIEIPGKVIAEGVDDDVKEIRLVDVADLFDDQGKLIFEDPYNAQVHNDAEIARLTNSVLEHGFLNAITVNRISGQVVGGHGRAEAALRAHVKRLTLIITEKDLIDQRTASIALNVQRYGHWNEEKLREQIDQLRQTLDPEQNVADQLAQMTSLETWTLEDVLESLEDDVEYTTPEQFEGAYADWGDGALAQRAQEVEDGADPDEKEGLRGIPLRYPAEQYAALQRALKKLEKPLGTSGALATTYAAVLWARNDIVAKIQTETTG